MEFNLAKLVVDLIADPSQLNRTLTAVRKDLEAWKNQVKGPIPIDEGKMMAGMQAAAGFGNALRALVGQMGNLIGVSGVMSGSLMRIVSSLLLAAGATGGLGLAIAAVVMVLVGLIALEYQAIKSFAEWNDEIIRQTALLDALGKQAHAIDEVVEASRRLADITRMNQDEARVLIMENSRVAKSFQDAADWAKVSAALAARFNVSGPITPEKIARMNESIFRMLELAREPGGMELVRGRMARQMGPEMRAALINVHTAEQLQRVLERFATQGQTVMAAEKTTFGFAWNQFVKDFMESLRIVGEVVGPPVVGFLEGLGDAFHELWVQVREIAYSLGIDKFREATPIIRAFFGAIFRFLFSEVSGMLTVIGWVVKGFMWLRNVLISLVEMIPFVGTALAKMLRFDVAHPKAGPEDIVNVPRIEGADRKAEFSGVVEFWKKLQQSVISPATDPAFWARRNFEEQQKSNESLKAIVDNTMPKGTKPIAVAA